MYNIARLWDLRGGRPIKGPRWESPLSGALLSLGWGQMPLWDLP